MIRNSEQAVGDHTARPPIRAGDRSPGPRGTAGHRPDTPHTSSPMTAREPPPAGRSSSAAAGWDSWIRTATFSSGW